MRQFPHTRQPPAPATPRTATGAWGGVGYLKGLAVLLERLSIVCHGILELLERLSGPLDPLAGREAKTPLRAPGTLTSPTVGPRHRADIVSSTPHACARQRWGCLTVGILVTYPVP